MVHTIPYYGPHYGPYHGPLWSTMVHTMVHTMVMSSSRDLSPVPPVGDMQGAMAWKYPRVLPATGPLEKTRTWTSMG